MSAWVLLAVGVLLVAAARFGRGRVPYLDWGLGALTLVFLGLAGLRQELALSGLYLALLAAGAMFPDERGTWPYAAAVACAAVAGLDGALSPLAAAAAAALAGYAAVSRALGVRRARSRARRPPGEEESREGWSSGDARKARQNEEPRDAQSGEAS